jgi:hypothetical protein
MLSAMVRDALSETDAISDPNAAKVTEGIKEQEIVIAESSRRYLLSMQETQQCKRLPRVFSRRFMPRRTTTMQKRRGIKASLAPNRCSKYRFLSSRLGMAPANGHNRGACDRRSNLAAPTNQIAPDLRTIEYASACYLPDSSWTRRCMDSREKPQSEPSLKARNWPCRSRR